jgi:superfamily I DNA/RNA helicase
LRKIFIFKASGLKQKEQSYEMQLKRMCPTIVGERKVKKFNYFYAPYNFACSTKKFMTFDEIEINEPAPKRSQSL